MPRRHNRVKLGANRVFTLPEEPELSRREYDDETKATQLQQLAKIVSQSTIEYPSDKLVEGMV